MVSVWNSNWYNSSECSFEEIEGQYSRLNQLKKAKNISREGCDCEGEEELVRLLLIEGKEKNCKYITSKEPPFLTNLSNGSTVAIPVKSLRSTIFSEELLQDCIRYWRGEVSLAAFYSEFNLLKSKVEIDPFEFRKQKWSWRQFSRVCFSLLSNRPEYSSHNAFGGLIPLSEQSSDSFSNFILLEKNLYINMELLWLIPSPSLLTLRLLRITEPESLTVQLIYSVSQLVIRCAQNGKIPSLTDLCLIKMNEFNEIADLPLQLKRRKRFLKA